MARKKSEVIEHEDHTQLENGDAITALQLSAANHHQIISDEYGDSLPYDRERAVREAQIHMGNAAEAMLHAGRKLIEIKENEDFGTFTSIVTERLGMSERTARQMMQATVKYSALTSKRQTSAVLALGRSKMIELMVLDDEPLAALAEGGTVANLTLDDVDRMSVRELRAALRESRDNEEARGRILEEKNKKLDDLAAKLSAKQKATKTIPPDQIAKQILDEITLRAFTAESTIRGDLSASIEAMQQHQLAHGGDASAIIAGALLQIERAVLHLRERFEIDDAPTVDDRPEGLEIWGEPAETVDGSNTH